MFSAKISEKVNKRFSWSKGIRINTKKDMDTVGAKTSGFRPIYISFIKHAIFILIAINIFFYFNHIKGSIGK